jgi:hypothetical protein
MNDSQIQSILENCKDPDTWAQLIESIRDDLITYELAFRAVQINGRILKSLPDNLIDYNMALTAVKSSNDEDILEYLPQSLLDYNMALEAVKSNGMSLRYIPDHLKDYDLVKTAVTNESYSLEYAGKFQSNKDICICAIQDNMFTFKYMDHKLQQDPEILLASITDGNSLCPAHPILHYTPEHLKHDPNFINKVCERNTMYASLLTPVSYKKYFLYGLTLATIGVLSYLAFINISLSKDDN